MRLGSTLLSRFVRSTSSHHRPWQIAIAVTAGALLGILPKTSLLFLLVGMICFVMPAHLPLLALTAMLISFVSPLLQPTLGRIGLWSLTHPKLFAYWLQFDSLPLVPWLGLHNTVVNGSLFAWLVASIPVYVSSRVASRILFDAAIAEEVAEILLSAEETSLASRVEEASVVRPVMGTRAPGLARLPVEPPVVIWDDFNHDQSYFNREAVDESPIDTEATTSEQVARRSADLAAWAEELITEELLMDDRNSSRKSEELNGGLDNPQSDAGGDDEERWLIETTMEMVRIAERAVTNQAVMKSKLSGDAQDVASPHSPNQESVEIQTQNVTLDAHDATVVLESSIRHEQLPHSDHRSHLGQTRSGGAGATSGTVNRPREEALHYLLRHLKGVQEKAQKQ